MLLDASGRPRHWPFAAYVASVACLVRAPPVLVCPGTTRWCRPGPASKSAKRGCQPSSLAQLGGVDRVAQVVAGPVGDVVEVVLGPAEVLEDQLARPRGCSARRRRRSGRSRRSGPRRGSSSTARGVVVGVDPVADVEPVAVELGPAAVDHVGDLARDELLDVLPGAVVVGAVARSSPARRSCAPRPGPGGRSRPWRRSRGC